MSLTLDNGHIYLEFEPDHGCITRFGHRPLGIDLVRERQLTESFRLLLPLPYRRGHYIYGRDQRLTDVQIDDTRHTAALTWAGLSSAQGSFDIVVRLRIALDADDAAFTVEVENRSGLTVEEVLYPALGGLANHEERDEWRLHYPGWLGTGTEWPFFRQFPGTYLGPASPVWICGYGLGSTHGLPLSMPWVDLYDVQRRRGVALAHLDPAPGGAISAAFAQLFPCTTYRGERQYWPDPAETEVPLGATLGWSTFPFVQTGTTWTGSPVAVHFHQGTWYAAADYYRAWFDRTMPLSLDKTGSWLAEQDAWQSTIISYPEDTIGYRFADLPRLAKAARAAGINVLQIDGWDIGGIDRDYPYYSPDPRLGSAEELREAIAACREIGAETLLFANMVVANIETDWYAAELHRYAVKDPRGFARNSMGWEYNTTLGLLGQCESRMVTMNPSHPEYRRIMLEQLAHLVDLGAAGTQIDKVHTAMGGIDYNPAAPLSPDRTVMQGTWEALREFLTAARARNPRFCMASETHWDRAMMLADAAYSRFFHRDHIPTTAYTFPEFRQSCCITGHYDYAMVNNCLRHGHIINVEARCLHGDATDAPKLAAYVKEALRLRRSLWEVLWHSRVSEPRGIDVGGDEGILYTLHRSRTTDQAALVLNHFEDDERRATVALTGEDAARATLHQPYRQPVELRLPTEITLPRDGVAIIAWDTGGQG